MPFIYPWSHFLFFWLFHQQSADDYSVTLLRELVTCWRKQPRVCSLWLYIFFLQKQILCIFFSFSSIFQWSCFDSYTFNVLSRSGNGQLLVWLLALIHHTQFHPWHHVLSADHQWYSFKARENVVRTIHIRTSFQGIHACISCCPFFLCNNKLRQCQSKCS